MFRAPEKTQERRETKTAVKGALAVLAVVLMAAPIMAAAFTPYFKASDTFTIDPSLTVTQAGIAYDIGTSFESVPSSSWMACTLMTSPSWTCPTPATTVFPGDQVAYGLVVSSPHADVTPSYNVSGTGFTTASYYATMSSEGYVSGVVSGLPTMAAGVQYSVWLVLTFGPTTTTSTETVTVSFGY